MLFLQPIDCTAAQAGDKGYACLIVFVLASNSQSSLKFTEKSAQKNVFRRRRSTYQSIRNQKMSLGNRENFKVPENRIPTTSEP